jgi:hypothetical protein
MKEIRELRHQLTRIYNTVTTSEIGCDLTRKDIPSREEKNLLREILTAGLIDRCARRLPMTDSEGVSRRWNLGLESYSIFLSG